MENEWGPSGEDIRYRYNVSVNSGMLKNLNVGINVSGSTAPPYTIYTGYDDNGDLVFNDRPAGVGRNSARGSGSLVMNANFSYSLSFGTRKVALPPGISITSIGGVMSVVPGQPSSVRPVPAQLQRQHLQHHEPAQPRRLQRRDDLAVLRPADEHQRCPARGHGRELLVLAFDPQHGGRGERHGGHGFMRG